MLKNKKLKLCNGLSPCNTFAVFDLTEGGYAPNNGSIHPPIGNADFCSVRAENIDNVHYVLFRELDASYEFPANLCLRIRMIPYSDKYGIQINGYRTCGNDEIKISTCFGYCSLLKFVESDGSQSENVAMDRNSLRAELGANYAPFLSFVETNLLLGQAILLRVEIDRSALSHSKLVLEYVLKSSTHTAVHHRIDAVSAQPMSSIRRIESIRFTKSRQTIAGLHRRMDTIFDTLQISSDDIVLIYGASNCGKSSFVHHAINRFISGDKNRNSVHYLECDPGQTEFAPCGILSLVEINQPIQSLPGFPFTFEPDRRSSLTVRNRTKTKMIISKIFGTITPADYSSKYIDTIQQLFEHYLDLRKTNNRRAAPLFVNTMGWIDGFGLQFLLKIINIVRPTCVVRICAPHGDETFGQRYAVGTIQELVPPKSGKSLQNAVPQDVPNVWEIQKRIPFRYWYASACVSDSFRFSPFRSSSLRREMTQIAYLTAGLMPDIKFSPLFSLEPIKLCLSKLYVHILSCPRAAQYIVYDLLNLSWVILGSFVNHKENAEEEEEEGEVKQGNCNPERIRLIEQIPRDATCLGCGIVRTIDCNENCIYVCMPHAIATNPENVINLLILPDRISIPSGMLNEQFLYHNSSTLPYIFSSHERKRSS